MGTQNTVSKKQPPILPTAVTGVSQQFLAAFSNQEIDVVIEQLTNQLILSYHFNGTASSVTDHHYRALLFAFRIEQLQRREVIKLHPILQKFGAIELEAA